MNGKLNAKEMVCNGVKSGFQKTDIAPFTFLELPLDNEVINNITQVAKDKPR